MMSRIFASLFALTLLVGCAPPEDKPATPPVDTDTTDTEAETPAENPEETPAE